MPQYLYLKPGSERAVVNRLSDIDYLVQYTQRFAGRPRIPVFIDIVADMRRTSVRNIRSGDWICLMQDPGASEGHAQCSTWDIAHVIHVRQITNDTGDHSQDMASPTVKWWRGFHVNCPHLVQQNSQRPDPQDHVNVQCRHYAQSDFHVINHQHNSWWCLFKPFHLIGNDRETYNTDYYQSICDHLDIRRSNIHEICEFINHGLDHQ